MPVDFGLFTTDSWDTAFRLDADTHWEIVEVAAQNQMPLLDSMRQYYDDRDYTVDELPGLIAELTRIQPLLPLGYALTAVQTLLALATEARSRGMGIFATAD